MNMFINDMKDVIPPSRMLVHTGHLSANTQRGDVFSIANKIEEMMDEDDCCWKRLKPKGAQTTDGL
jgi:hypothetical protein